MDTEKLFQNSGKYIAISQGMCVDTGKIWFVETNIDFSSLPLFFRETIKSNDRRAIIEFKQKISTWAKATGFIEMPQPDYVCSIKKGYIAKYQEQWEQPYNISTWTLLVNAENEKEAKDEAFRRLLPIGTAKNNIHNILAFGPDWIHAEKIKKKSGGRLLI